MMNEIIVLVALLFMSVYVGRLLFIDHHQENELLLLRTEFSTPKVPVPYT